MRKYEKEIYYTHYYSEWCPYLWRFTDRQFDNKLAFMNLNNSLKLGNKSDRDINNLILSLLNKPIKKKKSKLYDKNKRRN